MVACICHVVMRIICGFASKLIIADSSDPCIVYVDYDTAKYWLIGVDR